MAEPVPYGLASDTLDQATPAAKAVAARLLHVTCDPWPWERIDIPALFLNLAVLATWPRASYVWKYYHHIVRPKFESALFDGMGALDREALPDDQREAMQQVRALRDWKIAEDGQHELPEPKPLRLTAT